MYPETWPRRALVKQGVVPGPPHHGIGRPMKVGKEEIAGLVAALERYVQRDFDAEYTRWLRDLDTIVAGLDGVPGVSAQRVDPAPGQLPAVPIALVSVDPSAAGLSAADLINGLADGDPVIVPVEGRASQGIVGFLPQGLLPGNAEEIVTAIRSLVHGRVAAG